MLLGNMEKQPTDEWRRMIDVNVHGVLNGISAVLSSMKERREGLIINVSSVAGRKTFDNHTVYCGTKFMVHALSEGLRAEVANSGVRVAIVAPGVVEAELLSHTTNEDIIDGYREFKKGMGQALMPEDVANAIVYTAQQPSHVCIREIVLAPTGQSM